MSYNKVIVMGNLVRDPELRSTQSGTSVCNFTVASNHKYGDKEEKCFFPFTAFGKQAETIAKYFEKGKPILAEGRQRLDEYVDKEGNEKSRIAVTLEGFSFVRGADSEYQGKPYARGGDQGQAETANDRHSDPESDIDEDIPF